MTDFIRPLSLRWLRQHPAFACHAGAVLLSQFAIEVLSVVVAWHIYDITRDPFHLGLVGLVQFLPICALVLVTGAVADRFRRRWIMALCLGGEAFFTAVLLALLLSGTPALWPIYLALGGLSIARAFFAPASQALVPNLVPARDLPSGLALESAAWQLSSITGPVAGGLLYGVSASLAAAVALGLFVGGGLLVLAIRVVERLPERQKAASARAAWGNIIAGFGYIRHQPIVLGAISLDLFAVLLGGAMALLPVYARDILEVGPWGLGLLRAGSGIGALLTALWLARRPLRNHVGLVMFACVAIFGLGTLVFAYSTAAWLSILALAIMGAADMVSVVVRNTLIQLWTPDAVRGRVNAVNMVFIGASNELGAFRAGLMAAWIGTVAAVAVGGVGTLLVAGLWARWFPSLRRVRDFKVPESLKQPGVELESKAGA